MTRRQVPRKLTRALYRPSICSASRMKSFRASRTVCLRSRAPWRMTPRLSRAPATLSITQFRPVRPTLARPKRTDLGQSALPKASSALDSFAAVSGDLTGIVSGLTPTIASARGTLSQLNATLGQAKTTLSQTDASLAKVQDKLATAANDIAALQTSESMGELARPDGRRCQ